MLNATANSTKPDVAPDCKSLPPDERLNPNYVWPLAILTDLDNECRSTLLSCVQQMLEYDLRHNYKATKTGDLEEHACHRPVIVEPWSPSKWLLESIARQGVRRDSQGNLHALALLAHRSGRPRIFVADDWTKQQISETIHRPNEKRWVSVVLLSTRPQSGSDQLYVFAQRVVCSDLGILVEIPRDNNASNQLYRQDDQPIAFRAVDGHLHPLWEHRDNDIVSHEGCILRDPDRAAFTGDKWLTGHEDYLNAVITASKRFLLPLELTTDVLARAEQDTKEIPMPLWKQRPSRTHLVVFVLYQATAEDLERAHSAIQQAFPSLFPRERTVQQCNYADGDFYTKSEPWFPETPEMTIELIPWERHRLRSRRDLVSFYERYRLWDFKVEDYLWPSPLLFLQESFINIDTTKFGVVSCDGTWPNPTSISKLSLGSICRALLSKGHVSLNQWDSLCFSPDDQEAHNRYAEHLWHPDQPFYHRTPRWQQGYGWIAAFSLTNRLADETIQHIREEIVGGHSALNDPDSAPEEDEYGFPSTSSGRRKCPFVPWKEGEAGDIDGTVKDIWEILLSVYTYPGRAVDMFLCLDGQSALDQTVIFVKADKYNVQPEHLALEHMVLPRIKGFTYTRIPAHSAHVTFRESTKMRYLAGPDGWVRSYRRAGWPAPGTLVGDSEAEGDYVDLNGNIIDLDFGFDGKDVSLE